tara:strand:+ start:1059 stop:1451 length:393 start_codon:yes stop_codon:yes gene_type:complete
MSWQRKRARKGKNRFYSLAKKLRRDNKTTEEFEVMFNRLSMEEVIGLKLELASRAIGGKLFGFPIWKSMPSVTRDATLKYAMSASRTKGEAASFLGMSISDLNKLLKKFKITSYFEDDNEDFGGELASTR